MSEISQSLDEPSQNVGQSHKPEESLPEASTRPTTGKRRSGKKGRNVEPTGESRIGLPEPEYLNLGDAKEDVIQTVTASSDEQPRENIQPLPPDVAAVSQLSDKVYVQQVAGFRKAQRTNFENAMAERQRQAAAESIKGSNIGEFVHTTAEAVLASITGQTIFKVLAVILQGLLAGFTICHCLLIIFDVTNVYFITHYASLALPAHCLYYIALVICTLAALDRYDVAQAFPKVLYKAFTFQSAGVAVLCYLAATVLSLIPICVEERMTLYFRNLTVTSAVSTAQDKVFVTEEPWMEGDMQLWRGCLIAKAVLVTLAWVCVAMRPSTDLLSKHLRQAGTEFVKQFERNNEAETTPTDGNIQRA